MSTRKLIDKIDKIAKSANELNAYLYYAFDTQQERAKVLEIIKKYHKQGHRGKKLIEKVIEEIKKIISDEEKLDRILRVISIIVTLAVLFL